MPHLPPGPSSQKNFRLLITHSSFHVLFHDYKQTFCLNFATFECKPVSICLFPSFADVDFLCRAQCQRTCAKATTVKIYFHVVWGQGNNFPPVVPTLLILHSPARHSSSIHLATYSCSSYSYELWIVRIKQIQPNLFRICRFASIKLLGDTLSYSFQIQLKLIVTLILCCSLPLRF